MYKFRVLLVCPSLAGGGAEKVAAILANQFFEMGGEVFFFYWNDRNDRYKINQDITTYVSSRKSVIGRILSLRKIIIEKDINKIVSFMDMGNIVTFFALWGLKGRRQLPSIHSNVLARDVYVRPSVKSRIADFLHGYVSRRMVSVVAVSEGVKEAAIKKYRLKNRVLKIYNPVKTSSLLSMSHINTKSSNSVKLVTAGRLTEAKNIPMLFEVLKILNNNSCCRYSLDIFGDGELKAKLKSMVSQLNLENVVNFRGFHKYYTDMLRQYDVFVMSSRWEGFGNVLVEALCQGLPIVATDCPSGPSEILEGGRYGCLIPVDDVAAMVDCICQRRYFYADEDLQRHLKQFDVDVVAQQYLDELGVR